MKQIFDTPPKSTQDRFKNKSKKVLVDEIIKMMQSNQDKIKKNDLIRLHQILNITLN